jgi:RecB family exonuclease
MTATENQEHTHDQQQQQQPYAPPEHLSYSRLRRYTQCPRSYELHYLAQRPSVAAIAPEFGTVLHAALESLYKQVQAERLRGPFPLDRLVAAYERAWASSGLRDFSEFQQGLGILTRYAKLHPTVDCDQVLAVEQEFRIGIGRFWVIGKIDRVDRVSADAVRVVDYKSNRLVFSREEVDEDLQLSLYELAARTLWPWVRRVELAFHMLRHNLVLETSRNEQQLEAARAYVAVTGRLIESATEFPARLNSNCPFCDHAQDCDEYQAALRGEGVPAQADLGDLEAVGRERKRLAAMVKILGSRKDALDKVLKTALDGRDAIVVDGTRYTLFPVGKTSYPLEQTLGLLGQATGRSFDELAAEVATVDNDALDSVVKRLRKQLPRHQHALLRAELEASALKSLSSRLWAKDLSSEGANV